jgi:molybdopterin-binding protein
VELWPDALVLRNGGRPARASRLWYPRARQYLQNPAQSCFLSCATTAHVRIDVGGQTITASITNEAADELKLEKGKTAYAIIKATGAMVGVD